MPAKRTLLQAILFAAFIQPLVAQDPSPFEPAGEDLSLIEKEGNRRRRLIAHGRVCVAWHVHVLNLNEDETNALQQLMQDCIHQSLADWRPHPRSDFGLITFTTHRNAAAAVLLHGRAWRKSKSTWQTGLARVAGDRQNTLERSLSSRHAFQLNHAVSGAVDLTSWRLGLSESQRTELVDVFPDLLRTTEEPRLLLNLPSREHRLVDSKEFRRVVGSVRTDWLTHLRTSPATLERVRVNLAAEHSEAERDAQVRGGLSSAREAAARVLAFRTQYLTATQSLTMADRRKLELASKGAVSRTLADWERTLREQIEHVLAERRANDRSAVRASIEVSPFDASQQLVWQRAVEAVSRGHGRTAEAADNYSDAMASVLMVILDRELWLLPRQRAQVLTVLQSRRRPPGLAGSEQLSLFLREAARRLRSELPDLLSGEQQRVLDQLSRMPAEAVTY